MYLSMQLCVYIYIVFMFIYVCSVRPVAVGCHVDIAKGVPGCANRVQALGFSLSFALNPYVFALCA